MNWFNSADIHVTTIVRLSVFSKQHTLISVNLSIFNLTVEVLVAVSNGTLTSGDEKVSDEYVIKGGLAYFGKIYKSFYVSIPVFSKSTPVNA